VNQNAFSTYNFRAIEHSPAHHDLSTWRNYVYDFPQTATVLAVQLASLPAVRGLIATTIDSTNTKFDIRGLPMPFWLSSRLIELSRRLSVAIVIVFSGSLTIPSLRNWHVATQDAIDLRHLAMTPCLRPDHKIYLYFQRHQIVESHSVMRTRLSRVAMRLHQCSECLAFKVFKQRHNKDEELNCNM